MKYCPACHKLMIHQMGSGEYLCPDSNCRTIIRSTSNTMYRNPWDSISNTSRMEKYIYTIHHENLKRSTIFRIL